MHSKQEKIHPILGWVGFKKLNEKGRKIREANFYHAERKKYTDHFSITDKKGKKQA